MQVGVGVVFAQWILFYFQYFLQLTLELVAIFFIFIGKEKKMLLMLSLVPVIKQRFNKLINEKSQINRDQKWKLLFLQQRDQSQKFRFKLVKNRQKAVQRD